jgi:hypothetical protein
MNEEALNDSFNLFASQGYNGSIEDYKELIASNEDARADSYNLFKSKGYNGTASDFDNLMGIDNTIMLSDEELGKANDSANVDPNVESKIAGSERSTISEDGSLVTMDPIKVGNSFGYDFVKGLQKGKIKEDEKIGTGYALGRAYADGNTEGVVDLVIESVPSFTKTAKNLVYDQLVVDGLDFISTNIGIAAFAASEGRLPTPEEKLAIATASDYAQAAQGLAIADLRGLGQASDAYLDQYITRFDNTISEEIAKGADADFSQIAGRVIRDAVGSAPYTIASLNPYSAALLGTAIATDKFQEEFKENPDKTLGSVLGNAVTTGGIEMIDAFISRKLLRGKGLLKGGSAKMAEKAVKQMNKGISRKVLDILGIAGKEGLTEMGQSIATTINDEAWLGDEDTWATDAGSNIVRDMYSIIDEGIIGAFTGGGMASIATAAQGNKALKNRAEQLLKPEEVQKKEKEIITKIADNNSLKVQAEKEGKKSRAEALDKLIKKDYTDLVMLRNGNKAVLEKLEGKDLQDYAKNIDAIAGLKDGETNTEIENEIKRLQDVNRALVEKAIGESIGEYESYDALISEAGKKFTDKEFQKYKQGATKLSKDLGFGYKRKPKTYKTTKNYEKAIAANEGFDSFDEYIEAVAKEENISIEEAANKSRGSDGVFLGKGVMLIDESVAKMTGAITAASHEILHPVFNAALGDANAQGEIVKEFKKAMTSKQRRFVRNKLKANVDPKNWNTEYLTYFSDAILKNEINYDKNLFEKLKDVVLRVLKGAGFDNVSFDSGREVYNFLKEYNTSLKETGQVSEKAVEAIKAAETKRTTELRKENADAPEVKAATIGRVGAVQKSVNQEILDLTDALDAAEDAYAADPNNPTLEKNVELAEKALDEAEERALSGAPKPKVVAPKPKKEKKKPKVTTKKKSTAPLKKETAKSKKILDDIGNDPKGYNKNNPKIYEVLSGIIKSKSKAFRTAGGNVVNLATLPQFEMDNMIQETLAFLAPMITKFNPKVNDSLYGYLNSQLSNKMRSALKSGRVTEAEFTEDVTDAKSVAGDAGVIRNFADEKQIAPDKLIKASKVISPGVKNAFAEKLRAWALQNNIDFDLFKFGDVDPNATIKIDGKDVKILNEVLEELFPGVNPEKFLDSRTMFTSGEASIVLGKLAENNQELIELFINLLPRGAVMPKGKNQAMVKDSNYGKSTKLDGSILKNFYDKGTERFTKKAGLTPFTLKDNIRYSDVHKAFGMDSSGNKLNYQRAKSGIVLASAYKLLGKLIMNEVIRTDLGLTSEQQMNVGAGKGDLQFSKTLKQLSEVDQSKVDYIKTKYPAIYKLFKQVGISRTKTESNKAFKTAEQLLARTIKDEEIFNEYKTVLSKIKERRAKLVDSSSWTESELFTVAVFKKLKREGFKGLKILQKEINKDNQAIDYKFSLDGNVYYLEVKKSVNAILGSFGLHFKTSELNTELDKKYDKIFGKELSSQIVDTYSEARKDIISKLRKEFGDSAVKTQKLDNGRERVKITKEAVAWLKENRNKKGGWFPYKGDKKLKGLPISLVSDYYTNLKKGNIINFGDVGAFTLSNSTMDPFGFLPSLADTGAKIRLQSKWEYYSKPDADGFVTFYQRINFKFENAAESDLLNNKSSYNLQYISDLKESLENTQKLMMFSKTQVNIDAYNNANNINAKPKGISVWDFDDTLAKTKSNVLYTMPGEIRIFHGGDIKSVKDIDGFVYFSEDKKQAAAYAKGNQGEVSSFKIDEASIATEDQVFDVINNLDIKPRAGYAVDESNLYELIDPRFEQSFSKKDLKKLAVALKRKGIKAVRFTDTNISQGKNEGRETENIVVFDKKVVQEQNKLDAEQFAKEGDRLMAEGVDFDFSEFSKVVNGSKGPFFEKAMARNKKFGNKNVFILTARPANSANAIHEFLKGIGLDIPLENITGLANSSPQAKADWVVGKAAEGYNDFYFADDAIQNVKAVAKALEVLDVKSKVRQANVQFSKSMNSEFNQMIEKKSGIDARGTISKYKASVMGRKKGRFQFFIPPGAEDFEGLMYKLLDKGKLGEQQKEWFKKSLFDPFARGINEFDTYKLQVANAVRQLKKSLKDIPKELGKRDPKTDFKYEDAVRVYLWRLNGHEIKGISESDIKTLVDIVKNSPNLKRFARQLNKTMGGYPAPQESWLAGTITTDAINMVNTIKRKEFLETWQQNADIIFSEDNLNKLEATFGEDYVEALKDSLYRMKSGRNRPVGANKLTNKFMNWVNDSVATIMFFNTRSALLQTLSTVNFINWGDNNPLLAAKAFSNQKQFWSDFSLLFNSDFLKSRRTGLKNDVNADEIADAAATQTNKAKAALAVILKAGFLPTQIADSFAIAMGGASFYRNRVNTYMQKGEGKPGMGRLAAEEQAFLDFQEIAEATQQSSRPDRVSQQQASPLGRIILAFANTPMQYMRLTKKAFLDLKNGRGSAKENITKILYYAAIQNVIFSSLQAALFATLFDDEEEEETKKKSVRVANTMLDSMLRGLGIYGAAASTVKNIVLEIDKQSKKDRPDYAEAAVRALDLSPPISSKIRKGRSAGRAFSYKNTREKMVGFGLDNPAYYAIGQIASATANIPLDRAVRKANHVRLAFAQETKFWQSVSLLLGFSEWDLNMIEKDKKKTKFGEKMKWKKRKLKKRKLK